YLTMQGCRVSTASDGKEGLEKAFELRPDLILMDLRLPIIGGWEASQRIRADERTKQCPIVILTGAALIKPATLECDGWLTKPCPPDQVFAEITRILRVRREGEGSPQGAMRTGT